MSRLRAVAARTKHALQQAKHRVYLAYKPHRFAVAGRVEPLHRLAHRIRPVALDPEVWRGSHLEHTETGAVDATAPVPRQVFLFWTGDNPLSPARARSLEAIRAMNPDIDVRLITPGNLHEIVLPEHPLHPSYEDLALIHRSDYLRCYVMNFHGGAYMDLKPPLHPWGPVLDAFDRTDAWFGGYRVPVRLMTPTMPDPRQERAMLRLSEVRLGQCGYISRPRSPLTEEWWHELNRRMDQHADELARVPGNARATNPGYPVGFGELLAQIVDPIQVKYRDHLFYDARCMPSHEDYL